MILRTPKMDAFDRSMSRLRALFALVIVTIPAGFRPSEARGHMPAWGAVGVVAVGLLAVNALSRFARPERSTTRASAVVMVQIAADVVLAVSALYAFRIDATSPISFVLLLPVLEAAVRFRMLGAVIGWAGACLVLVVGNLAAAENPDAVNAAELAQVAVVLLAVSLPVAYVAEHLVGDILATTRARFVAERRSETLGVLALSGRDVNALTADEIAVAVASAARHLGGVTTDAQWWDGERWTRVGKEEPAAHHARRLLLKALPPPDEGWEDGVHVIDEDEWPLVTLGITTGEHHVLVRVATERPWVRLISEALEVLHAQARMAFDNAELYQRVKTLTAELTHRAEHDPLTGLANRRRMLGILDEALEHDDHPGFALLYIDLDGFKPVNDRLGHLAGDELLVIVAKRFKKAAGAGAMTVRIGGDEFAVLVQDDRPHERGERICRAIWEAVANPIALGMHAVTVGASIGLATVDRGQRIATADFIHAADERMYENKRARKAHESAGAR